MNSFSAQRSSAINGVKGSALLDYAVYFEAPLKETIDVCILFAPEQKRESTRLWGTFQLWLKDFDSRWFDQFWDLFIQSQVFRQQVKNFYGITGSSERADTEQTLNQQLESVSMMLKSQGFDVKNFHIGGTIQSSCIESNNFPRELVEAARQAGFRVDKQRILAGGLVCQPIANLEANKAFGQLLAEWTAGCLQPGSNYAGWCTHIRTCSLVPSSIKVSMPEQSKDVTRVVDRSLNGTLTYSEMANLRSGRDHFSKVNMSSLLSLLNVADVPELTMHFEESDQRKILRWMCRGLPEGLAIQKVLIDRIKTEEQRQRSKKKLEMVDLDTAG